MANEDEGLKEGEEEKLPAGDDQPEKETPEESEPEKELDDSAKISQAELDKVKEDRDNYRKAFLSLKKKSKRVLHEEEKEELDDEYLTRKDLYKANEEMAIANVLGEIPEIDENWEEIISYYAPRRGRGTVEGTALDIKDAYYLWKRDKTPEEKPDEEKTQADKAKSELSSLKGEPVKGKEKGDKPPEEAPLFPPKTPDVKEWYKTG